MKKVRRFRGGSSERHRYYFPFASGAVTGLMAVAWSPWALLLFPVVVVLAGAVAGIVLGVRDGLRGRKA